MQNLSKILILSLKILFSGLPTAFFLYVIGTILAAVFSNLDDPSLYWAILLFLSQIGIFLLLIYYINWAIWTKGVKRKVIMAVVMIFFWAFTAVLTMGPS